MLTEKAKCSNSTAQAPSTILISSLLPLSKLIKSYPYPQSELQNGLCFSGEPLSGNQFVPLSYSLVNHREFFKKVGDDSIQSIVDALMKFDKTEWPHLDEEYGEIDWICEEASSSHIQVSEDTRTHTYLCLVDSHFYETA